MGLFKKKKKQNNQQLNSTTPLSSSEEVFIKSTEELNKTDGVVTIAEIKDGNLVPNNIILPQEIDIEERKNKLLLAKKAKQKKIRKNSKEAKTVSTITSLIVLVLMAGLGGFYYYVKNQEKPTEFQLKELHIELGEDLPTNVKDYVKRENIDEMEYTLDITEVNKDKVGEYNYYVTFMNVKRTGKIIIEDTQAPTVETEDLYKKLGSEIKPEDFIKNCTDKSNCKYAFEDANILSKLATPGEYEIFIIVQDDYNNMTRKKVSLVLFNELQILKCTRGENLTEYYNYYLTEQFEIYFADNNYLRHNLYNYLQYNNKQNYEESKSKIKDTSKYQFNDDDFTIVINQEYSLIENYSLNDYEKEFTSQGYICTIE